MRPRVAAIGIAGLLAVMAACSSTTTAGGSSGGGSSTLASDSAAPVDEATVAATAKKLLLSDVSLNDLDPAVRRTFEIASRPWTPDMQKTLMGCMKQDVCDTGNKGIVVAFPNDNINAWRQNFRAEFTAQAIQSGQVSKVIYSLGTDVASWLANFKSLIAQRPDVIVMDSIYGPAILPAVQQAKAAGITVVEAETPLPASVAKVVDVEATSDLCGFYSAAVKQLVAAGGKGGGFGLYTGIPGNASAANWQPCAVSGLKDAGYNQVIQGFTQWTPQGATQAASSLYASGKNPAVIAYDDSMEYFTAPYLRDNKTPPVMIADVVNFAYLKQVQDATTAGVDVQAYVANARDWYGRVGLTAGLMLKQGEKVNQHVDIPYPAAPIKDVLANYDPSMPANTPVPTSFSAADETAILAAGS